MNKGIMIVVLLVVLIGAGAFIFTKRADLGLVGTSGENNNEGASTPNCPDPGQNVISYCNGSFTTLTVVAGTSVTFKNDSTRAVEVASDPHPVHTDNDELNAGRIAPGESKTVTLNKKGTWGFHNHIIESERGTVVVQ